MTDTTTTTQGRGRKAPAATPECGAVADPARESKHITDPVCHLPAGHSGTHVCIHSDGTRSAFHFTTGRDWHEARAAAEAKRAGQPAPERRNETRHPDGAAAVDFTSCPTCKARKGEQCFKSNGTDRTPYVHGTRMAKWDNS